MEFELVFSMDAKLYKDCYLQDVI